MSDTLTARIRDFTRSFTDVLHLPRAFWFMHFAFAAESMAYFGMLTLMVPYLSQDLGWGDAWASVCVSFFTGSVTLFMLGAGSYAESFGLRRAILAALILATVGRILYCLAPGMHAGLATTTVVLGSLVVVAIGEAILQPVCYSGIKQYTDEKTSSMGYGLIYAIMNLGIFLVGGLSTWVRPNVQRLIETDGATTEPGDALLAPLARWSNTGIQAVNWVCVGITAFTLIVFALLMTKRAEAAKLRPDRAEELRKLNRKPLGERLYDYFFEGPFTNGRFIFFIFMLLPVRTLFAHQWLTMPSYVLRAFDKNVADRMEVWVNWINALIIFFGVPLFTALTRRVNVYTMMILGSLVSAAPTFLLATKPDFTFLISYLVLFSIGEALWSARFLEYASEIAPEGRIAQYMGLAQIPWIGAKMTTGIYSGYLLNQYCPADTPIDALRTGTMWFIYACIAMMSPIGLWLARKWVMAGLHTKSATTPAV